MAAAHRHPQQESPKAGRPRNGAHGRQAGAARVAAGAALSVLEKPAPAGPAREGAKNASASPSRSSMLPAWPALPVEPLVELSSRISQFWPTCSKQGVGACSPPVSMRISAACRRFAVSKAAVEG